MKISEAWLREWVKPSIETEELVAKLTMAGLEVDAVEPVAKGFNGVVIAEIESAEPHPDADKLRVCQVNDGQQTLQIVCGAPNAKVGIRAPLARVGAVLPDNFNIKQAKLRGVESQGMLCAREELGVSGDSSGLWELPADAPIGADIRDYLDLDDKLIDIDLTPNRADCLSIRGIAREVGVLCQEDIKAPDIPPIPESIDASFPVSLVATDGCPHYVGRVVKGVDMKARTPDWMRERLARSDIGSIHPAVDVTNYVMLELGQPMHAFDLAKLSGEIAVRYASPAEKLTLLDEREVSLDEDVLLITDDDGPLAMAGVMGGLASAVTETTTDIFLESAFFNPLIIAGKARRYGLHTDSSHRYERGVDPALQNQAMERATQLLTEIAGGQPGPISVSKADDQLPVSSVISLRQERLERLIGCTFAANDVQDILDRLGLETLESDAASWKVRAPSWRFDLSIEADLIEEVARIYGYDRLPERTLACPQPIAAHSESLTTETTIKRHLTSRSFREVISYSFIAPDVQASCFPKEKIISVRNPIAEDMSVMRTSLLPGLLKTCAYNLNRQHNDLRLFEFGMVFNLDSADELVQTNRVAGLLTGARLPQLWANPEGDIDFYDAKREVELLLADGAAGELSFSPADLGTIAHPGQCAKVSLASPDGVFNAGWVARAHPSILSKFDINQPVYLFELDETYVTAKTVPTYRPLSRFPGVRRDIALVVNKDLQASELIRAAREHCGELLIESRIFDIYHGQGIDSNEKSVGIGLTFRDYSRTLNDELVTQQVASLVEHLEASHNARIR